MTQQTSITKYENILSQEDIGYLLNLQEVKQAREDIDSKDIGKIYFSIELPPKIQQKISQIFNINVTKVPMRWIKGDTPPHEDKGMTTFMNTYLIYLTDSQGSFVVDGKTYPITQNTGYVFSEGLKHETINTGSEPRLLLGPMSEQGFAVGSSIGANGGSTIYFGQVDASGNPDPSANISYKVNDGAWFSIGNNYPMYISNYNTTLGFLNIEFFTDLIINDSYNALGINKYFICGSEYIQFGKSSLKSDGTRPTITVQVDNYPGLIDNGRVSGGAVIPGYDNISVYNINVIGSGSLLTGGGWICQSYFSNRANNNYIINCSSTGSIGNSCGGITGSFSAENAGQLTIIGCSSTGSIGDQGGGIVGGFGGQFTGNITCQQCYSTGTIGFLAGGIFGEYAGFTNGIISVQKCYSAGTISNLAGGIFGRYAGATNGNVSANSCYNTQVITTSGGGIYGQASIGSVTNSYVYTILSSSGSSITVGNCYIISGSWNSSIANSTLQGIPSPIIGTTWVSTGINTPYILNNFGYTPYDISNISNNSLIQSYSQTINAGSTTIAGIRNGLSYQILDIFNNGSFGSFPSITINSNTGRISTTSGTTSGSYTLYIRNNDDYSGYNITQFNLTVNPSSSPTNEFSQLLLLLILLKNRERKMILGNFYNKN